MRTFKANLQSLFWPVLFFIAGICTSSCDLLKYLDPIPTPYLIVIIIGIFYCFLSGGLSHIISYHHICQLLFFIAGWSIATVQEISYDRYSMELSKDPAPTGKITDISRFAQTDRFTVQLPKNSWWTPAHHFNITLMDKGSTLRKGQIIRINRPLSPIKSDYLPFSFQAKEYWHLKNTSHDIFLYDASDIQLINETPQNPVDILRQKGLDRLDKLYPDPGQSGILKALLFGHTDGVSREVKINFRDSGLLHVLAVSGLHVGIVCGLLFFLLFPIKLFSSQQGLHSLIVISALWAYALLTGMNIPVVRAVILMTFYLTATPLNRQKNKWHNYLWAMMIVLVIQPKSLFSVSFQLSFSAVAAILIFYTPINQRLKSIMGQTYFTSLTAVSLAAQIGVLPLLLWHFQQISWVSTLSSFLVIPLLFPLILLTAASIITPISWDWMVWIFSESARIVVRLILGLSEMLSQWEFSSHIVVWHPVSIVCLIISLVIAALYMEIGVKNGWFWMRNSFLVMLGLCFILESGNVYSKRNSPVLVIFKHQKQTFTEFYYQGRSYSNFSGSPPPSLLRIRQKYYIRDTLPVHSDQAWAQLLTSLEEKRQNSGDQKIESIQVVDCIDQRIFDVSLTAWNGRPSDSNPNHIIPALMAYKIE